ncbi:MAG: hypothetical protein AAF907_10305 [Planctomycetota bacterium]
MLLFGGSGGWLDRWLRGRRGLATKALAGGLVTTVVVLGWLLKTGLPGRQDAGLPVDRWRQILLPAAAVGAVVGFLLGLKDRREERHEAERLAEEAEFADAVPFDEWEESDTRAASE